MSAPREWVNRLWATVRRRRAEPEWEEELRLHLDLITEEAARRGDAPDTAVRAAALRAGNLSQAMEALRDQRGLPWLEDVARDMRLGLHGLRRHPAFATVAILTLALGIGANTAIFSVVNAVVLRPLSFSEPERLISLASRSLMVGEYLVIREHSRSVDAMALYRPGTGFNLSDDGDAARVSGTLVSANFFATLGNAAALGRTFLEGEDRTGARRVIVLSDGLWRERFGADATIVGREITVDAEPRVVVGVMPPGFSFPGAGTRFWIPFTFDPSPTALWGGGGGKVIARLRPAATPAQAQAEWRMLSPELRKANTLWVFPKEHGTDWEVIRFQDSLVGNVRTRLLVILGAVAFVLLIACANVANLLLSRAGVRQRELAVRHALGAGRSRIVRQLLTESAVLGLLGGATGLMLAFWSMHLLVRVLPADIPRVEEIGIDRWVLGFTLVTSLFTGVSFGVLPALRSSRSDLQTSLRGGDRSSSVPFGRTASALVIGEMAVAVLLVIGAGLLIRSLAGLMQVDPGFRTERILTARVTPPVSRYGTPCARDCIDGANATRQRLFYQQVLSRIGALPGVQQVEGVSGLPLADSGFLGFAFEAESNRHVPGTYSPSSRDRRVTPGYFQAMGIRLLRGRTLADTDRAGVAKVAVVNETMAREQWPGEDPIGKRFREVWLDEWTTVVGVVADVKFDGLARDVTAEAYRPFLQIPAIDMSIVVRTSEDPAALAASLRKAVASVDPMVPVSEIRTIEEIVSSSVAAPRFTTLLLAGFAALALTLAAIGIYGVLSHAVSRRTREIGVRMALGARRSDVLRMVLQHALLLATTGAATGVAAAFATTRVLDGMLFGVSTADLGTFAAVPVLLIAVALAAAYVPASRATRVDPTTALMRLE